MLSRCRVFLSTISFAPWACKADRAGIISPPWQAWEGGASLLFPVPSTHANAASSKRSLWLVVVQCLTDNLPGTCRPLKEGAGICPHQVRQGRAAVSSPPTGSEDKQAERGSKLGLWWRAGASLCQKSPYLDAICKKPNLWAAKWGGCKGRMLWRGRRWPWVSCDCMWVRDWGGGREELRDRKRLRDREREREEGGQIPNIQPLSAVKCSLHIEGHPLLLLCSSRDWYTQCP